MITRKNLQGGFQLGQWLVQPDQNRLSSAGNNVRLAPRSMEVLLYLAERAGEVVTRDDFSAQVWHPSVVTDDALTGCISELRRKLGDTPTHRQFIETVPKRGYRLVAEVKALSPEDGPDKEAAGPLVSPDAIPNSDRRKAGRRVGGRRRSGYRIPALAVVLAACVGLGVWFSQVSPSASANSGVAVLPFENLSPDPDDAFFAGGMHEEVLTSLSHIDDLRVISRSSMHVIAEEGLAVPEIGSRLGVSHVLEGSVRRSGHQVRVTVQLIDAETDDHLWAENYDRDLSDIFAIQSDIALAIADQLEINLDPTAIARLAKRGTSDLTAYELYLEGRERLRHLSTSNPSRKEVPERLDQIEALFRAAIDQDPEFAAAHAALSYALLSSLYSRSAEEAEDHYLAAVESSRRAIRLDPNLAAGYLTLGKAYYFHGAGDAAWEQFRLAADIDPNDPDTLRHMFLVLFNRGEYVELVQVARRAASVEPNLPGHQHRLGQAYRWLGHTDRARDAYRRAWEQMVSNPWRLHSSLALTARDEGDWAALRRHLEHLSISTDGPSRQHGVIFRLKLAVGDIDAAEAHFDLHQEFFEEYLPIDAALIWTHRGESEKTEQALQANEHNLRNRIPRQWGSQLQISLAWIEVLRGQHEKALDHMEAAVDKGFRFHQLLWRFGHPDAYPPIIKEFVKQPRFRSLQARVDTDIERMREELAALEGPKQDL